MKINPYVSEPVDCIPGLCQEAQPSSEWPYAPDWIVQSVSLDTEGRTYWVSGRFLGDGKPFFWGLYVVPLSWRYDLSAATYSIGKHVRA